MNLKIMFEDESIIVCHKNSKIAVETAKIGEMDMVSQLKNYMAEKTGNSYMGVVHRLDQPVEGVMVFAKNPFAAAQLSKQISQNKIKKYYLAVLCAVPDKKEEKLIDYLLKNGKTNTSSVVAKETKGAKKSELIYRIWNINEQLSLAEIELITGRHHQIRVQMSHAKLPLWGDVKYNKEFINQRNISPALCAYKLEFLHPKTNQKMEFKIEPTGDIFKIFE